MSKTEIHGGMLYSNIGKGQDQTANTGPDFELQFQNTSFLLHNLLQDTWILNLSILQPTFDEKAGFSFAFLKTNLYWLYQMKNKKTTKPNQTQTKKNPNQNQTKKTPKKPKPQVAQFWSTSPKSCFQGQVKNWVMRMPGGFAIKLLLLLQAKQSTCRSCSLLVLYGYFSQPFSSHPEEISGTITLVITNTHQPQSVLLPQKVLLTELERWGFGFCWFLTPLSQTVHFTAWHRLWHHQRKPIQKDEWCQGVPASFAQWRAAAKGDRQPTANVAPVTQKEIFKFKGVSGKLVKCNLAILCNSWIKRTQNITTVTAMSFQKAQLRAIILHCWPRLACPRPQSGWDILRLALQPVLEKGLYLQRMINIFLSHRHIWEIGTCTF